MSLSKRQQEFTACVGLLIAYATMKGYGLTFGDAYRDTRLHGKFGQKKGYGSPCSVHKYRLAVDFNLFIDGQYIEDGHHSVWKELGEYWKTIHVDAVWGGDFEIKDSNHMSFAYGGYM